MVSFIDSDEKTKKKLSLLAFLLFLLRLCEMLILVKDLQTEIFIFISKKISIFKLTAYLNFFSYQTNDSKTHCLHRFNQMECVVHTLEYFTSVIQNFIYFQRFYCRFHNFNVKHSALYSANIKLFQFPSFKQI